MENKINIAEILRDMPKGTKLYSPMFGKRELIGVDNSKYPIVIKAQRIDGAISKGIMKDGRYFNGYEDAECSLYPSVKMRCWDNFFKRGDIVYNPHSQMYAVFECWANDDYTEFNTTINHYRISDAWGKGDICSTLLYTKATDEERAEFIAAAEKRFGGKYNPETLRVRPLKESFKSKCQFEPFQKVLVRCGNGIWGATFFSRCDNKSAWKYVGVDCNCWEQCIPYEGNEHLLGTDKSPE